MKLEHITKNGTIIGITWRKDFKFIGIITCMGFGKYYGIKIKRSR